MNQEDYIWLLWGIGFSFALQVIYDGIGEFPKLTQKYWGGIVIAFVYGVVLFLYMRHVKGSRNKPLDLTQPKA
jgi:hypothetical protein